MQWKILKPPPDPAKRPDLARQVHRMNALGSLFYFLKVILGRHRLSTLHQYVCGQLEREDLHMVLEMPMGHFKTTVATEGLPVWWSLPFSYEDECIMRRLGYDDAWIRWMQTAHSQSHSTLLVHETESLAIKYGRAIDEHYKSEMFTAVFPEIQPDNSCVWNDSVKCQRRPQGGGDATYQFRGVGQSLQGIHVRGIVEDDLVGKAALDSVRYGDGRVMEATIDYHRKVSTRFDPAAFTATGIGKQLVIGNRWHPRDLNGWIRDNLPEYRIETHGSEGGCCKLHAIGKPIFPEEYTMERLASLRKTEGDWDYSHHYLNLAVLPEEVIFRKEWLRYFTFAPSSPDLPLDDPLNQLMLRHEVSNGETIEDIHAGVLVIRMLVDPNHSGKRGRCRHALVVEGYDTETNRKYLLDVWAKSCGYTELVDEIYKRGEKWNLSEFWLETVASQKYLKFYLEEKNQREGRTLFVNELPLDNSANAKERRIEAMEPMFRNQEFWCHRSHSEFIDEYASYPAGRTVDVLDVLGYAPRVFEVVRRRDTYRAIREQQTAFATRSVGPAGY